MLKPEIQEALKALLPQAMQARAYVAGGYAQSPELAEDIDLWVVDQQAGDVDALRHHLFRSDFEVSMPSEDHIYSGSDSFLLLANVWIEVSVGKHQLLQKVQILISPVKTILELMNRFDITTHQVAVKLDNLQQYAASTWTAPALQPRVVAWHGIGPKSRCHGF